MIEDKLNKFNPHDHIENSEIVYLLPARALLRWPIGSNEIVYKTELSCGGKLFDIYSIMLSEQLKHSAGIYVIDTPEWFLVKGYASAMMIRASGNNLPHGFIGDDIIVIGYVPNFEEILEEDLVSLMMCI